MRRLIITKNKGLEVEEIIDKIITDCDIQFYQSSNSVDVDFTDNLDNHFNITIKDFSNTSIRISQDGE